MKNLSLYTFLGFTPYWYYKSTNAFHADNSGVHTSAKILSLSTIDKIHLKCDVINGSIQNGLKQPILFSFVLDKKPCYKIFCQSETVHYKKTNQSVLNTICFYLEDNEGKEVSFNGERLTFTLQMIKI